MLPSTSLISAIVIFFNTEKYIEEAIQSIFAQTYDNWELLLVDDGSTDGSSAIAQHYAAQYPNQVRYLEHEGHQNRGMSASRNLGAHHAKGEFIAFLDADDVWLPEKLEKQLAIFEQYPEAAMVCGPNEIWHSWTGNPEDAGRDRVHQMLGRGITPDQLFLPSTLLKLFWQNKARTPGTCSILIRLEVFNQLGGFEEDFRGMFEDRVFFSKVYLHSPVFIMSECLDKYRRHPASECANNSQKNFNYAQPEPSYLKFLHWTAYYLSTQEATNSDAWNLVQKQIFVSNNSFLFAVIKLKSQLTAQLKSQIKSILSAIQLIHGKDWFLPSNLAR
jgi:glycosyltransferase involved in cell wall biosynthesis